MEIQFRSLLIGASAAALMVLTMATRPAPAPTVVYTYKQFSTIESVVPAGLGRSRVITSDAEGQILEKELKNFYSATGINFRNVLNNDRVIVDNINGLTAEGWELYQVSTGVNGGGENATGIFITRYLFRKPI